MRKMTYGEFLMQQQATEQQLAAEDEKQRYQSEIVPWSVECSVPSLSIKEAGKATRAGAMRRIDTILNVFSAMTTSIPVLDQLGDENECKTATEG